MIIGDLKNLEELESSIAGHKKVLILGCRGCVTVCQVGGEKEVALLASQLRIGDKASSQDREILELSIERQCDAEYIEPVLNQIRAADVCCVVSGLWCGCAVCGRELIGRAGYHTNFIGVNLDTGLWKERCQASCVLEVTGGICPIAAVPKACSTALWAAWPAGSVRSTTRPSVLGN